MSFLFTALSSAASIRPRPFGVDGCLVEATSDYPAGARRLWRVHAPDDQLACGAPDVPALTGLNLVWGHRF